MLLPLVITSSSETKVISICYVIIGAISLKLSLALGLLCKTFLTALGMLAKGGALVGRGAVIWRVFRLWPNTFARVGDMLTICSGVAVKGSTAGPFCAPLTLCPSVPSGESNFCPTVKASGYHFHNPPWDLEIPTRHDAVL